MRVLLVIANLLLMAWGIYLTIKIAQHVNAWPF